MTTTKEAKHQCPKCERMFVSKTGLGSHLRTHGIHGKSKSAIAARKAWVKCPDCNFATKNPRAMTIHHDLVHKPKRGRPPLKRRNKLAIIPPAATSTSNGHHPEAQREDFTNGIPDALVALTTGRFQELCRNVAEVHGLPSRLFTARVAALVYSATIRQ